MTQRKARRRPRARQLTSGELADLSGISKRSVVKAIADGRIKASTTAGGHYRIALTEARRFMNGRGLDTSVLDVRENCVLVVARDRFLGDLLADVLSRAGAEVLQAENLFAAGVLAATGHPWLVVVDAASAGPDPVGVCRSISGSEACRQSGILILAGADAEEKRAFLAAGASGVLGKPFSVKQLKETLRDLGFSTGNFGRIA